MVINNFNFHVSVSDSIHVVGDLKPANFVFVKGHLKLIDFGIAKSFNNDTTNIYRESQIGTVRVIIGDCIHFNIHHVVQGKLHGPRSHSTNVE